MTDSETPILSASEVAKLVRIIWKDNVVLKNYEISDFSKEKLGVLSAYNCLDLKVLHKSNNQVEIKKLFLKSKLPGAMSAIAEEMAAFHKEMLIYNEVIPFFRQDFKGEDWSPKCYMTTESCLVFEDLRERKFALTDVYFTKDEMTSALTSLASLHAACVIAEDKWGRPINEVYPDAVVSSYLTQDDGIFVKFCKSGLTLGVNVAKKLNLDTSKLENLGDDYVKALMPSKTKRNVFCHGDLWVNNIMFNRESPPKCLFLDYQISRYSTFMHDVMFLLYLCANRKLRTKYEKVLVKHYYNVLVETLKENKFKKIPSWSEVVGDYEDVRLAMAVLAMNYFPVTSLTGEQRARIFPDTKEGLNGIAEERNEAIMQLMKEDRRYAEVVENSVIDLVELLEKY